MAGYDFQLVVRDIYSTSTALDDMPTKEVFLDVNETTGSMGFGGEASDDASMVRYDFYGPVYFRGGVMGTTMYSMDEVDTGNNWINGKRIYARTLIVATPSTADNQLNYPLSMTGMDMIWVDTAATFLVIGNGQAYPHGYVARDGGRQFMVCPYPADNYVIVVSDAPGTAYIRLLYTKTSDTPTYYYLPFLAADSNQGCVASASSTFSADNQAFKAFNGIITGTNSWWASAGADTDRWVQVEMPYALKNMVVTLTDREDVSGDHRRANTAGAFLGSNDGAGWTELFSFTDRNPDFVNGFATTYQLNNATAYKYLRYAPAAGSYSSGFATSVADIRIEGEVVDA